MGRQATASPPDDETVQQRRRLGIMAWLIILSLFPIIPVVVFSVFTLQHMVALEEESLKSTLAQQARLTAASVEQNLGSMMIATAALAQSDAALHDNVPALYEQAQRMLKIVPEAALFSLLGPDGEQIFNTSTPLGLSNPRASETASARTVFETGKPNVSDLYYGAVIKMPAIAINTPVVIGGRVVYCVRMAVRRTRSAGCWPDRTCPPNGRSP